MKALMVYFVAAIAICALLYGAFWLAKNGSYWLWYEDMVKETIREMVRQESLNR
jgi:hypothetical protein